jgi:hypothetical protein
MAGSCEHGNELSGSRESVSQLLTHNLRSKGRTFFSTGVIMFFPCYDLKLKH